MRVYTRSGDKGETSLWGGKRVSKADPQVECYGTLDEASSCLGLARGLIQSQRLKEIIVSIQQDLQVISAEVASTSKGLAKLPKTVGEADIRRLENIIDDLSAGLPKLTGMVLPGGTAGSGGLDLARTIVRRAERLIIDLRQSQELRQEIPQYLNRLSDLLFVMARVEGDEELVQIVKNRVMEHLENGASCGMSLVVARKMIAAAQERAETMNLPVVACVVDAAGNLLVLERQEEAILASIDIARGKAFTSAATKMPTHELAQASQPGQPLYGIESTNQGRLVIFGGGFPLKKGGKLMGAIGISGGSVEQDIEVARAAVAVWNEYAGPAGQ
jgi:ATP:cob(I)alamin adenosyltransferase